MQHHETLKQAISFFFCSVVIIAQGPKCLDGLAMMHEEKKSSKKVACNSENKGLKEEMAASLFFA